jgi:5'-deoxy-5'-methylthioadenosine phosphorylase
MSKIGIIGGSGLTDYPGLIIHERKQVETNFGSPSAVLQLGKLDGVPVVFLPRHGDAHTLPPHKVNYRANIMALKQVGVKQIVAVAAVGGIAADCGPGVLAVPDQIIDYTHGREQSFFSDDFTADKHLDFTWPYDAKMRENLLKAANNLDLKIKNGGTYGATQGPRLETAAEIKRMSKDGCDLVGMTGMPECYLARELDLPYATIALVANWGAGIESIPLTMEAIQDTLALGMDNVRKLLAAYVKTAAVS